MHEFTYVVIEDSYCDAETQTTVNREFGPTPNGNEINGRWVLRIAGKFIDFDTYRSDLMERNNIKLIKDYK